MKRVIADGVEVCPECEATVQVFKVPELEAREFIYHFKQYPEVCYGLPLQESAKGGK